MIGDDDSQGFWKLPLASVILAETSKHKFLMKPADSLGTQNTNTHLYYSVYAEIFKSKLQAAKHPVSSNQFLTQLTICQMPPQFAFNNAVPTTRTDQLKRHKE